MFYSFRKTPQYTLLLQGCLLEHLNGVEGVLHERIRRQYCSEEKRGNKRKRRKKETVDTSNSLHVHPATCTHVSMMDEITYEKTYRTCNEINIIASV